MKQKVESAVLDELRAIRYSIENLLILECARTGMKRDNIRAIVSADNNRISRITRYAKHRSRE